MARKVTDGPLRNKERTKLNLISALGKILKKDGFSGLTVTKVAEVANLDRRLIYDYFGGLDSLVHEYLSRNDYWKINKEDIEHIVEESKKDSGRNLSYQVLLNQFDSLINNEEMRRIIIWGLSEKLPILKELDLKRENIGNQILVDVIDEHFKNTNKNFRAVYALLMGGVYYLTLHAKMQENPFCGIDVQQPAGARAIKDALKQILDFTYG